MKSWAGVILAGGKGSRMVSRLPKVLHKVCGKEMFRYPVDALKQAGLGQIYVVVSPEVEEPIRNLLGDTVAYVVQTKPLGTGDALLSISNYLQGKADHLVVIGADSPLITSYMLNNLVAFHMGNNLCISLLTAHNSPNDDMGKVTRDTDRKIKAIIEVGSEKGPIGHETEINGGVYCFESAWLWENLAQIQPSPNGERLLTALISMGSSDGVNIDALVHPDPRDLLGVNNRLQLTLVEAIERKRIQEKWMRKGVTLIDPASTFIDTTVTLGQDTIIYPNTLLLGHSHIKENCILGPGTFIKDTSIGSQCHIRMSAIEGATLDEDVEVGPFSHIRSGSHLERGARIGNFAEVTESRLGHGVKMGHFGYVGNADIGANSNLGAGMVTCNFDGLTKNNTIIEENVLVGSGTMFIAPVRIGAGSATGAGAVVNKDIPANRLAVGIPAKIVRSKKGRHKNKSSDS